MSQKSFQEITSLSYGNMKSGDDYDYAYQVRQDFSSVACKGGHQLPQPPPFLIRESGPHRFCPKKYKCITIAVLYWLFLNADTECPKIYRKSILHLLRCTANQYFGKCSIDLRFILGHSVKSGKKSSTSCSKLRLKRIWWICYLYNKKIFLLFILQIIN